jgi:putative endonuclease
MARVNAAGWGEQMKDPRRGVGRRGEDLAVVQLTRCGYVVRNRNWRCPAGEVDIVADHEGWLVFIEVRARRSDKLGSPEASITPAKRARLIQVAESYLTEAGLDEVDWRIDVVAVELAPGGRLLRMDVYENAVTG